MGPLGKMLGLAAIAGGTAFYFNRRSHQFVNGHRYAFVVQANNSDTTPEGMGTLLANAGWLPQQPVQAMLFDMGQGVQQPAYSVDAIYSGSGSPAFSDDLGGFHAVSTPVKVS